ncbi:MAG TPA: tRNA (guanine(46)-N(7))-methyltransferase TrmB [Methyloceanibacter sp.]
MDRKSVPGQAASGALPLRSYGRRKARPLSGRKEQLIGELLPRLRLNLRKPAPSPLAQLFDVALHEVWLEIGFGSGEHLLWQIEHHPEIGFVGAEPFINGVASLLGAIETRKLKTIRIHDGDAREVLSWLPSGSIGAAFILFPDPWPKKRQQKRRLLSQETVAELARILRPGGLFRFASDDDDYAGEALFLIVQSGQFAWQAEGAGDWRTRPADWKETRYERKALAAGRKSVYLSFTKL